MTRYNSTMQRTELITYLNNYLNIEEVADYGPQGLQVETENATVQKIALAVDVAPPIIEAAAAWGADMLLVHHGILWGGCEPLRGAFGRRVRLLMAHGINLYAAHLALDAHAQVGNNAVLAEMVGVTKLDWWCAPKGTPIGTIGMLPDRPTVTAFTQMINEKLVTDAHVTAAGPEHIERLAIVSGSGIRYLGEAKALGADTLLTGETDHASYWSAADMGMNVIYAGHYATETVGVQALGRHLTSQFGVETHFFDFPTRM